MQRILLAFIAVFLVLGVACSSETNGGVEKKEVPIKEESPDAKESKDLKNPKQKGSNKQKEEQKDDNSKETSSSATTISNDLVVHYIDVGQADATLFQYVHNDKPYTLLFDVGDWNKKDVVHYLHAQEISSIDLIIISHPHADHIGQLAQIMDEFTVDEVWFSGNTVTSGTYQDAAKAVLDSDADYYEPTAGETFEVGSLGIEILHPSKLTGKLNEDSISVRMTYGEIALIFTGDAYKNEELQMIARAETVKADILQLGHHGSKTSSDKQFIDAVQPDIAIYSAGVGNAYGHPHIETLDLMKRAKVDVYGTDVHGTIIVTTDGTTYDLSTDNSGSVKAGKTESKQTETKKDKKKTNSKKEAKKSSSTSCIDINTASAEQLEHIKHIGPARAEELIKLRPFDSVNDLARINGIGPSKIVDIVEEGNACIGGN